LPTGAAYELIIEPMKAFLLWLVAASLQAAPVKLVLENPLALSQPAPGVWLVDFGRVSFGNLQFDPPVGASGKLIVRFGEALANGRIDRRPPGSVRYAEVAVEMKRDGKLIVAPPADPRTTKQPAAVLTPPEWGVVLPFRWVEIEGWPGTPTAARIVRRTAIAADWNDADSSFHCSDPQLDAIWELCKHSIKATSFAGVYVDGDRERIPYEADAYLNQLSHYATSGGVRMARDTFDRLMKHPTWPSEWAPHMVFIAHADWMRTGDAAWLKPRYAALKSKLLADRVRSDGLVESNAAQMKRDDIVDWPAAERDGYVFTKINTVVNAFHIKALEDMADLAAAVGNRTDAESYKKLGVSARSEFDKVLLNAGTCLYKDGVDTEHVSLHANLFPLAFGLAPDRCGPTIAGWLAARGMRCSVYGAQYLMDALFENGRGGDAIRLMTAPGDRSWRHMVESGATITWEAWDQKYKPNQDWNHAWGAAPANLLPRHVLGAQPLVPGWKRALIRPCPGELEFANGKVPTQLGPLFIDWKNGDGFHISVKLPAGMGAKLELPAGPESKRVLVNGRPVSAARMGDRWILAEDLTGSARVDVK
jgi:hypothetical protein